MSIYLGKIVALFALPLGWVLLAGMVALGLLAAKRRRAAGGGEIGEDHLPKTHLLPLPIRVNHEDFHHHGHL